MITNYDVIVVGGGITGCAAAISASKHGVKTLLIESSGFLGGAASNCLVFPFMPYATSVKDENGNDKRHYLSRGFFDELRKDLLKFGNDSSFGDEDLKRVLDNKTTEAGVDVLFHAVLCGVEKDGNHIKSVSVATKSGVFTFDGKVFVDTTGDADLIAMAKIPNHLGRPNDSLCQPMTLCFRVANVDIEKFRENRDYMQKCYRDWRASGKITNPREDILVFEYHPVENMLHFNTTRVVKLNPVDPFDVSKAEMTARYQVEEIMNFFKEIKMPGMENAQLVYTAPYIGVRESRMLTGEYVLTGKDLVDCTKFDDSIAAGNYDIDIHNPEGSGTSHYYFPKGTWYTIPYRSLIPKNEDCDNLLTGGRCISVDHEAQASIRIMPICCTTGEAAGIGAYVAVKNGSTVQNADITEIQKLIADNGGYIGKE